MAEKLKELLSPLKLSRLIGFYRDNADCLHLSRYHRESFPVHCYLVIINMLTKYRAGEVSATALLAACLHDIGKPRTAALNKRNEACFYGHEQVTDEELSMFIDQACEQFEAVAILVRNHMVPMLAANESQPEKWLNHYRGELERLTAEYGAQFRKDLDALCKADQQSSIKDDAEVPAFEQIAWATEHLLEQIAEKQGI